MYSILRVVNAHHRIHVTTFVVLNYRPADFFFAFEPGENHERMPSEGRKRAFVNHSVVRYRPLY